MEQAPNAERLDDHLNEVAHALHGAVSWAMSHRKDASLVDKAVQDCQEILTVILEGRVSEWLD